MSNDIPESVSQRGHGAYDEESRRIKEISDELQRLCRVHETQPREGQATYIVWDVVPRNVLVDADGDMYVVNAEIKKL